MHDSIEDTRILESEIAERYGPGVATIVRANSKNSSLPKDQILEDIVNRCAACSKEAMIVKAADVLDNYAYYLRRYETDPAILPEIERCQYLARLIAKYREEHWQDPMILSAIRLAE